MGDFTLSDRLVEVLYGTFKMIAATPRMGRPRPEYGRGLRSHPVDHYMIYYRPKKDHVVIVRVLHQRQDAANAFRRRR